MLLAVEQSSFLERSQPIGQDLVAQGRQPRTQLPERARSVQQIAQEQRGPPSTDGGQGDLHRTIRLGGHGLPPAVWD